MQHNDLNCSNAFYKYRIYTVKLCIAMFYIKKQNKKS